MDIGVDKNVSTPLMKKNDKQPIPIYEGTVRRGPSTFVVNESPQYGKSDLGPEHSGAGEECPTESWLLEGSQQERHAPETAGVL